MSGEWTKHDGSDLCPLPNGVMYELDFGENDIETTDYAGDWNWGSVYAYRLHLPVEKSESVAAPITSDGGSSDYYKLTIKNKAGETIQCEMGDVIRDVFGNDFNLGNVVKAARRMHLAAKGVGKEGTTVTYDTNKIKYFASEFEHWNK